MCGIAGQLGHCSPDAARRAVKSMVAELAHRGPDWEGTAEFLGEKRGFPIPAERWLVTAWRKEMTENLKDLRLARLGFIDREAAVRAWADGKSLREAPRQLWYVHALETWLRYEERFRNIS